MRTILPDGLYFGKQVKDMVTIQKGSESFQFKAPQEIRGDEAPVAVLVEGKNIKVDYRPDLLKSHIDLTGYHPFGHAQRMIQSNHLAKSFSEDKTHKLFKSHEGENPVDMVKVEDGFSKSFSSADERLDEIEKRLDEIEKAGGEGSKGGKVIGHTKSGKPIYESHRHETHKNFTAADHYSAVNHHEREIRELAKKHGTILSHEVHGRPVATVNIESMKKKSPEDYQSFKQHQDSFHGHARELDKKYEKETEGLDDSQRQEHRKKVYHDGGGVFNTPYTNKRFYSKRHKDLESE